MGKKIKLCVLFGGRSAEHEVSIQSARNIVAALDPEKYEVVLIGIDKQGRWSLNEASLELLEAGDATTLPAYEGSEEQRVTLVAEATGGELVRTSDNAHLGLVDVVFPVIHGPLGEDGTVQGLLKLFDLPFVGGGVLGSAVGMDKDVMKRLLRDAGLAVGNFKVIHRHTRSSMGWAAIQDALGDPVFVKPANLGSSVGISKVTDEASFEAALDEAFRYDAKVVVEAFVDGREIEVSVLGNEDPEASVPGEVIPHHDFYSYEAKYLDENGAALEIPADLTDDQVKRARALAIQVFQTLCCEGMGRVDLFLTADDRFFVNEINTIPGFTRISMYPKLWEASGVSYSGLIDRLVRLAIARHKRERKYNSVNK